MRISRIKANNYFILALVSLMAIQTACGKKNKDNGSGAATGPTTKIEAAEIQEDGSALITFSSEAASKDFMCQVVSKQTEGDWYPCPQGHTSHHLQPGQSVMVNVKNGPAGVIDSRMVTRPVLEAPGSNEVITEVVGINGIDPNGNYATLGDQRGIALSGNRFFQVPEGMRVARYSDNNGFNASQVNVFNLIPNGDPVLETIVPTLTLCESGGSINAIGVRHSTITLGVFGRQPYEYCKYNAAPQQFKQLEQLEMSMNQIDVASEPGMPFEYISASVFQNQLDADTTRRRFTQMCGIPMGVVQEDSQSRFTNPFRRNVGPYNNLPNGVTGQPFNSAKIQRNNGFIEGGTFRGLPLASEYWAGQVPARADFHWCKRKINTLGVSKTYFIGSYEIDGHRMFSADKIVFHYVAEPAGIAGRMGTDLPEPYEFARMAQQLSLDSIQPNNPNR